MDTTDYLIFMANKAATPSIGSWEELVSVTFDVGANAIVLMAEGGGKAAIPCNDLEELHRLAQISYTLAEGHDVLLEWHIPVLAEGAEAGK